MSVEQGDEASLSTNIEFEARHALFRTSYRKLIVNICAISKTSPVGGEAGEAMLSKPPEGRDQHFDVSEAVLGDRPGHLTHVMPDVGVDSIVEEARYVDATCGDKVAPVKQSAKLSTSETTNGAWPYYLQGVGGIFCRYAGQRCACSFC